MVLERWLYALNMGLTRLWKSRNAAFLRRPHLAQTRLKIVIVKLDEIGDMATTLHVFALLKETYPKAIITVLCKPFTASLLLDMENFSGKVIHSARELPGNIDVWLELRGTWKTALLSLLNVPRYRADRGSIRFEQRGDQAHEIWTNYRIIQDLLPIHLNFYDWDDWKETGMKYNQFKPSLQLKQKAQELTASWGKFAIFHPAARRILRQWSPEKFAEIANHVTIMYRLTPVLVGTPDEKPILDKIKSLAPQSVIWINTEGISTLCAVLMKAQIFVGNESGPLQLAGICNIPRVGIFGPGVPYVFYPVGKNAKVVHEVLGCNPCDQIHCKYPSNPCIQRIATIRVISAIDELFAN